MTARNRVVGWSILAALLIAVVPLIRVLAFGSTPVAIFYAVMLAIGVWLTSPQGSLVKQLSWTAGLSIVLVVAIDATNAVVAPGEEGGVILGFIVFGIFIGLPTFFLATAISVVGKLRAAR